MRLVAMPTIWRLNELMARHRVAGKELADELGISTNAVSSLRKAETMPKINGERLDQIAIALTKLSKIGGVIHGVDLLEEREA